ncbi:MAG: chemotaxis protein CheW [Oleiphilaceae bacterium]|nr:chemotaxis protein CheW [Oleiphilaceae bacterium]
MSQTEVKLTRADANSDGHQHEYLTFLMGAEEFGVEILAVQEIRGWESVTPIPNAPDQVCGVMNLRGTVVPVVDLRACFGVKKRPFHDKTIVIVVQISSDTRSGFKIIGVVADAVADVECFPEEAIQAAPDMGNAGHLHYVRGLGQTAQKMVILLELDEQLLYEQSALPSFPQEQSSDEFEQQ